MRNRPGILIAVLVLVVVSVVPSIAVAGGHGLTGTSEGPTVGFNPDPGAVADRCPDGFEWILSSAGSGEIETAVYSGPFEFVEDHCSRWINNPMLSERTKGEFTGKVDAGILTIVTDEGTLTLETRGRFAFEGVIGEAYLSRVTGSWNVVDGTGVFADARGHGSMKGTDENGWQSIRYIGSLIDH